MINSDLAALYCIYLPVTIIFSITQIYLYVESNKRKSRNGFLALLFISILISFYFSLVISYGIVDLTIFITLVLYITSVMIYLSFIVNKTRYLDNRSELYFLSRIVSVVMLISHLMPPIGASIYSDICRNWDREKILFLADQMHEYKKDNGDYPESLEKLSPGYIKEIPELSCVLKDDFVNFLFLHFWRLQGSYATIKCGTSTLIIARQMMRDEVIRYNLNTKNWSSPDWLDGLCSYLK